ncbi:uncharacterized protein METZ01_LOCUS221496 [marine metagenome]|uniref:dihydropteroate synthase n=1 Tax=marine metagenome TaxID=408172 RepID=A0A382G183_9ZZZZ
MEPKLGIQRRMNIKDREYNWGARTYVMGIVNVTPDSFSGDGLMGRETEDLEKSISFAQHGADFIDVGAESTRPNHIPTTEAEEIARIIDIIQKIAVNVDIPVSVDTYKPEVARLSVEAGASMINNIWGVNNDLSMLELSLQTRTPIIIMHNQIGTHYNDFFSDLLSSLYSSVEFAVKFGIQSTKIVVDPGFGFGKTPDQNLEILKRISDIKELGFPVLMGISRKSTIGYVLNLPEEERLEGTEAAVALCIAGGVDIVRVHDVKEIVRVVRMCDAVVRGWRPNNWIQ